MAAADCADGLFEDSNKLSFSELDEVLKRNPLADGRVLSVDADLWPAMQNSVSHVFRCGLTTFAAAAPAGAMFELCTWTRLPPAI